MRVQAVVNAIKVLGRADCSLARHLGGGSITISTVKSIEFHVVQDHPTVGLPVVVIVAVELNHVAVVLVALPVVAVLAFKQGRR